ncbi:MAG: acetylornithine deacetylase [Rhodospirillaceae bacterium]|nr:acetylornithine deacetylase [Rhodospirillaceae bacterium]
MTGMMDAVALTRTLIGFDTINPPGHERACAEHLGGLLEAAGFAVGYHAFADDRTSLIATRGRRADLKPLCFTGHIDTVPLGAAPWTQDPFAGDVIDGKMYGRGTTDMKSGVAAFVAAAIDMADSLDDSPGVVLVITAGEETGCEGARHMAMSGVLGEAGAIVIAEPTSNYPFVGHKGALWLKGRTSGVTAHGSMPDRGVNALYKAARAVAKLEDFDFNVAPHEVLGKPTLNVGTLHGGLNVNSVPDLAEVGIDIRTIPGMDHGRLREGLSGYLAPDVDTLDAFVDLDGIWTDPRNAWMSRVAAIASERLGEKIEVRTATYFTDGSILTPAYGQVPSMVLGPGEPAMAHQTDEYCYVDRIPEAVELYKAIISDWMTASVA